MQSIAATPPSSSRVPWPRRVLAVVATIASGALLALVIAFWGWRWFAPSPEAQTADKIPEPWAPHIIAAAPFGRAAVATTPAAAAPVTAAAPTLPSNAQLLGLFAGRDGEGYALFRLPDRGAILVARGEDIVPDVKLDTVHRDRIAIIERGQRRELLLHRSEAPAAAKAPAPGALASPPRTAVPAASVPALSVPAASLAPAPPSPAPASPASGAPASTSGTKTAATSPACARPPGFTGPVYRLNAELLQGMINKPETWQGLLAAADGALVVRDETGLAAMLGMKSGDRIVQSNGIALNSIDDMATAVVRPLISSQPVHLRGTRDGQPRDWLFLNAGVCHS